MNHLAHIASWYAPSRGFTAAGVVVMMLWLGVRGLVAAPALNQSAKDTREYEIKAAFLYHFTHFVEWSDSGTDTEDPFSLCILGDDPFGATLDPLEDRPVEDKRLAVRRLDQIQDAEGCHILFISSSEKERVAEYLKALQVDGVLTVGEAESFTKDGGIIRFFKAKNKIRFEVNLEAAHQAGLKISSRMLKLAKIV